MGSSRDGCGRGARRLIHGWGRVIACGMCVAGVPLGARAATDDPESSSVSPRATYTGDLAAVVGGDDSGLVYLDNLDLTMTVHLEPLVGWRGADLFVYALGNQGGSISSMVGDRQTVDNIEAPTNFSVLEAWYEQHLGSRASVLVGLYDINSEFDHLHSANLFVNSSFGLNAVLGAAGENGPSSFPVTSLSARLKMLFTDRFYVQAAVVDGVPGNPEQPLGTHVRLSQSDGALVLLESGLLSRLRASTPADRTLAHARRRRAGREGVGVYRYKLAGGNWWFSAPFDDFRQLPPRASSSRTNYGGYFVFDGLLMQEPADAAQGVSAHGRLAYGNPRFNAMALNFTAGLTYTGLIPGRDTDESGLAVSSVWAGRPYRQAARAEGRTTPSSETAIELTHLLSLNEWFSIQLDAQWIENPGMDPTARDALVLLSRYQGAF